MSIGTLNEDDMTPSVIPKQKLLTKNIVTIPTTEALNM